MPTRPVTTDTSEDGVMASEQSSPIRGRVPGRVETARRIVLESGRLVELIVREGADVATLVVPDGFPLHLTRGDLGRLCAGADWASETVAAQDRVTA